MAISKLFDESLQHIEVGRKIHVIRDNLRFSLHQLHSTITQFVQIDGSGVRYNYFMLTLLVIQELSLLVIRLQQVTVQARYYLMVIGSA